MLFNAWVCVTNINSSLQDDEAKEMDEDRSDNSDEEEANPLVVPLAEESKPSREHLSKQWFSQDVFEGVNEAEELSDDEEAIAKIKRIKRASERPEGDEDEDMGGVSGIISSNGFLNGTLHSAKEVEKDDFEVVPREGSGSSDSDTSEASDEDSDHGKAEILAYAKKMLRKKSREAIIDESYNRYTFNDVGLPRWFYEDERKHNKPEKPVTKDEVEAMKVCT